MADKFKEDFMSYVNKIKSQDQEAIKLVEESNNNTLDIELDALQAEFKSVLEKYRFNEVSFAGQTSKTALSRLETLTQAFTGFIDRIKNNTSQPKQQKQIAQEVFLLKMELNAINGRFTDMNGYFQAGYSTFWYPQDIANGIDNAWKDYTSISKNVGINLTHVETMKVLNQIEDLWVDVKHINSRLNETVETLREENIDDKVDF